MRSIRLNEKALPGSRQSQFRETKNPLVEPSIKATSQAARLHTGKTWPRDRRENPGGYKEARALAGTLVLGCTVFSHVYRTRLHVHGVSLLSRLLRMPPCSAV
jgi:hypothetical protein